MPKWMPGTSGWRSASSAKTRREWGRTKRSYAAADNVPAQLSNSWNARGSGGELDVDELDRHRRQGVHQLVPGGRVGVLQRLGVLVGAARPAFDEVAGDGERGAGEGEHGRRRAELGGHPGDRVGDIADVVRQQRAQPPQILGPAQRFGGDRAGAWGDVDAEADGMDRNDDVAEEHGGIDRRSDEPAAA